MMRAHLHDAPTDQDRCEISSDGTDVIRGEVEGESQIGRHSQHDWQLHRNLKGAADDRSPGQQRMLRRGNEEWPPKATSVAIKTAFHITGAA